MSKKGKKKNVNRPYVQQKNGQKEMAKEQEEAAKEQEEAAKEQEETVKEQEEAVKEQEEAAKEQEEAAKEQEEAVKEQEEAVKEQEEAVKEQEETAKEQEEAAKEQEEAAEKKRKRSVSDIVRSLIMVLALVVFGYASYELTLIYVESREGEDIKNEAAEMFLVDMDDLIEDYEADQSGVAGKIDLVNERDGKLFVFDYEKMLDYNSDAKGYIRQDNGEYIDNPILQHADNDYYLTHLANHRTSSLGAIFIDSRIPEGLEARNCIIYGHNIGDRANRIMFGSLNWYYSEEDYYKEHPTFDIWVGDTRYRYYVFAIYKTEAVGSPVYTYTFNTDEEFMNYVNMCKNNSRYNFSEAPDIALDSHIVTLSTCTHSDDYRMIVQLVRGEELDKYGEVVE